MKCSEAEQMLSAYLDQELNKEEAAQLELHLADCEKCRRQLEELSALISLCNDMPLLDIPEGFHDELMAKISQIPQETEKVTTLQPNKPKKRYSKWIQYSTAAACFIVLLAVGSNLGNFFNHSMPNFERAAETPSAPFTTNNTSMDYSTQAQTAPMPISEDISVEEAGYDTGFSDTVNNYSKMASEPLLNGQSPNTILSERKYIKTLSVSIKVSDFDDTYQKLKEQMDSINGYIENFSSYIYYSDDSSEIQLREGNLTLRLPIEHYSNIHTLLSELGTITDENESTQDITNEYLDTSSKLKTKQLEESRLMAMIPESASVEDLIKIEERLSQVRSEIEAYSTSLSNWDKLVELSTIHITMTEVSDSKLNSISSDFSTRIKNSFIDSINQFILSIQDFTVSIIGAWVPIGMIAIVVLIVFVAVRAKKRKQKKQEENPS